MGLAVGKAADGVDMRTAGVHMRTNEVGGGTVRTMTLTWKGLVATAVCLLTSVASARAQCPEAWLPGQGLPGTGGSVYALAALPDGDVIVGGDFTTDRGAPGNAIARFNPRNGTWSAVGGGMNRRSMVLALATLPDGDVVAGGTFVTAGGVSVGKIARYRTATDTWEAIGTAGDVTQVTTMTLHPSGDLIVGGQFTSIGGVETSNIARYNLRTGTWSALGGGVIGAVTSTAVLLNGDIIAGGYLTSLGDAAAIGIARFNPATGRWSGLQGGVNGFVNALAVLPNGTLVVGGQFLSVGQGLEALSLACYDPLTDAWSLFPGGTPVGLPIGTLAVVPGGKLILGGPIGRSTSEFVRMVMYDPATNRFTQFGERMNDAPRAILAVPGGDLIIGGSFSTVAGVASLGVARNRFGTEAPRISVQPASRVINCPVASATFTVTMDRDRQYTYEWRRDGIPISISENPSAATARLVLARLTPWDNGVYDCSITNGCGSVVSDGALLSAFGCPCPLADIAGGGVDGRSPDGTVDGADFIAFINSYALGDASVDPLADIRGGADGSTAPNGIIDEYDFFPFITSFTSGC